MLPSVHPPSCCGGGGAGGVKLQPNFQKRDLTGPQLLEGGGGEFLQGLAIFTAKINENLKYLMIKKVKSKNIFLSHS